MWDPPGAWLELKGGSEDNQPPSRSFKEQPWAEILAKSCQIVRLGDEDDFLVSLAERSRVGIEGPAAGAHQQHPVLGLQSLQELGQELGQALEIHLWKHQGERAVKGADSSGLMSWSWSCCLLQDLGFFTGLVVFDVFYWSGCVWWGINTSLISQHKQEDSASSHSLIPASVFVPVPFTAEFTALVIQRQEGNNQFKEGNPRFQLKEKYCRDPHTWWTSTGRKL